MHSSESAERPN
jgi:hypothetical protein